MKSKTDSPNILISGAYGTKNLGDTKILEGLIHICREHYLEPNVIAASVDPEYTETNNSVDRSIPNIERDLATWLKNIRNIDIIILGGGTIINHPEFAIRHGLVVLISQLANIDVYVTAGVDDNDGYGRTISSAYLNFVDAVTVRDPRSKRILHSMGIEEPVDVVPDPGLVSVDKASINNFSLTNKYILVNVSPSTNGIDVVSIASALDDVNRSTQLEILFLPFHISDRVDIKIANEIIDNMATDAKVISDEYTLGEAEKVISQAEAVVGMRLHGLILAAHMRTSLIGISYSPKCELFLEQIGIENYHYCDNIDEAELSEDILAAVEQDFLQSCSVPYIKHLESKVSNIISICESQKREVNTSTRFFSLIVLLFYMPVTVFQVLSKRRGSQ